MRSRERHAMKTADRELAPLQPRHTQAQLTAHLIACSWGWGEAGRCLTLPHKGGWLEQGVGVVKGGHCSLGYVGVFVMLTLRYFFCCSLESCLIVVLEGDHFLQLPGSWCEHGSLHLSCWLQLSDRGSPHESVCETQELSGLRVRRHRATAW